MEPEERGRAGASLWAGFTDFPNNCTNVCLGNASHDLPLKWSKAAGCRLLHCIPNFQVPFPEAACVLAGVCFLRMR